MARKPPPPKLLRPYPPQALVDNLFQTRFAPAPELLSWATTTFLDEAAPLHNPEHQHLQIARIGFLWASAGYHKGGRQILGQTEDLRLASRGNGWQRARAEQQLAEWFGPIPDFLITLDGHYCAECSDAELCALVEHELYHIGHLKDEFGVPQFYRDSGLPKLGIRGHDVEEFVGVTRRYGPSEDVARLIMAAAKGPEVAPVNIARACGTCQLRAAA